MTQTLNIGWRVAAVVTGGLLSLAGIWAALHATSVKVREWSPGAGRVRPVGRIAAREFGSGDGVIVLLPGIAASESFYGAAWDGLGARARVVAVDTLGFGSAVDTSHTETRFTLDDHLAALDAAIRELGLDGRPLTLVGHSMGASLAINWAARTTLDVQSVVAFDAPLYVSTDEAHERVGSMGWFEALLASGPLAESVCAWMCRHHDAARAIAVVTNPRMPVRIAQDGMKHTWPAYIGGFDAIVTSDDWREALAVLEQRGVPVLLADGASDPVPVPGRALELAQTHANVSTVTHPGGHDLPLTHPQWCASVVREAASFGAPRR